VIDDESEGGIRSNIISSKLLELETANVVHSFVLGKPRGRTIIFPNMGVAYFT